MSSIFTHKHFKGMGRVLILSIIVCISAFNISAKPGVATGEENTFQVKTIKCYPNPAVSFVNFEFPQEYVSRNFSLQVYSFTGRKMYEANVTAAKSLLTFNNEFYRGIYVYQLLDKTGKILETGKFQVNR